MKPGALPLLLVRLLDPVRERIRYLHYSLSTGKSWHGLKRPRDMGPRRYQCYIFNSYSRISDEG